MLKVLRGGSLSGALVRAQHGFGAGSKGNVPGAVGYKLRLPQRRLWHSCPLPDARSCPCVSLQCIVIGLQSTGEARTREVLDENDGHLNCFVSAAE